MRTFGVEEELLLVDERTGAPLPVARRVLEEHRTPRLGRMDPEHDMTGEIQQEMIEVMTAPHRDLEHLAADIGAGRLVADSTARAAGARAVPLATSPLAVRPHLTPKLRYLQMGRRYGPTARESLTCGMHVHVSVESEAEGVGVLDRIRPWLPVLLALSGNSPFCHGEDTGHSSYRYVSWLRWPLAGPTEAFGTPENYARHVDQVLATGALVDSGMLYFDARLSRSHPTVEVRIADICLLPEHSTLLAALVRGLVEVSAREWQAGVPPIDVSVAALRLASWRASLEGLNGELVHPLSGRPRPARDVVDALLTHVGPALDDLGDTDQVDLLTAALLESGNGADRQRATFARTRRLRDVVADAITAGRPGPHVLSIRT
jgi:carboxylate-amine ligase